MAKLQFEVKAEQKYGGLCVLWKRGISLISFALLFNAFGVFFLWKCITFLKDTWPLEPSIAKYKKYCCKVSSLND